MVFGALTMLFLVISVVMVFQSGILVDRRIEAQNAADAAAYSGACTKAMCVNSIEWLNSGMAYIYSRMLDYEYDEMYFSAAMFSGQVADGSNFSAADMQSRAWIERGTRWMQRIAAMEEGIANACPRLVSEEVYRVARANGAEAAAIWPDAPAYEAFDRRDDHLNCIFEPRGRGGWFIASNSDYVLLTQRQGTSYWDFCIHDNSFANNGVRAQNGVSVRIRGTSVYFYDGTTYNATVTTRTLPGNPPTTIVVVNYGDGTEDYLDLLALQQAGQMTVIHTYRYVTVEWTIRWMQIGRRGRRGGGGGGGVFGVRAEIGRVMAAYGNTYVESYPTFAIVRGGFYNGAMSATYEIVNTRVQVNGPGRASRAGNTILYEDFVGIGSSGSRPEFVEDTVRRFLSRSVRAPNNTIEPALGRTRHSDEFAVGVLAGNTMQRIPQVRTWTVYGGADDYQAIDLARLPLPLSISEQFLRWGVNVGVWMPPEGTIPFFTNPKQGFFAVASARLGKRATTSISMLTPPDDTRLTVWLPGDSRQFDIGARYSYINTLNSANARWSAVSMQRAQGYWYAVLEPVKSSIVAADLNGPAGSYQSSAELIFDKLLNSEWHNLATGLVDDSIPPLLREIIKPEYIIEMDVEWRSPMQQEHEYYYPTDQTSPPFEYMGTGFDDTVQH